MTFVLSKSGPKDLGEGDEEEDEKLRKTGTELVFTAVTIPPTTLKSLSLVNFYTPDLMDWLLNARNVNCIYRPECC